MNVLYISGSCLTRNTSANMSHNSYLQGLIENGAQVDVIMANDSWGEKDNKLPKFNNVTYYEYGSVSFSDKLRNYFRRFFPIEEDTGADIHVDNNLSVNEKNDIIIPSHIKRLSVRDYAKKLFYSYFKPDPIYPLNSVWLEKAVKFKSGKYFDLVISNSSPAASHKLVTSLKESGGIKYKKWIQIWEDPWYFDLYGGHGDNIKEEEHSLLLAAEKVYYVSPLTLYYQKSYFPDCAKKMGCIPLPYLKFGKGEFCHTDEISFGYFGDYYSHTRDLIPFYQALKMINGKGFIYGDSDLALKSTEDITISGRVTLDVLEKIQEQTSVLVHLCNLRGGQIPGKIYHYSATAKPILFILDGTDNEKSVLKDYFSKYNRYVFCNNTIDSIRDAMNYIICNYENNKGFVVEQFSPKAIVADLLKDNVG